MPAKTPVLLALAAGASVVSAHGYVSSWSIDGETFAGFDEQWAVSAGTDTGNEFNAWSESASDNGYVAPDAYGTSDIICHRDATNGLLNNATIAAGGTLTATWNTWPDSVCIHYYSLYCPLVTNNILLPTAPRSRHHLHCLGR